MICAWKQLLNVLPPGIRMQVESDGGETLQELRLRLGSPPEMITADGSTWLSGKVGKEEMDFVVNSASQYSPGVQEQCRRDILRYRADIGLEFAVATCHGMVQPVAFSR